MKLSRRRSILRHLLEQPSCPFWVVQWRDRLPVIPSTNKAQDIEFLGEFSQLDEIFVRHIIDMAVLVLKRIGSCEVLWNACSVLRIQHSDEELPEARLNTRQG